MSKYAKQNGTCNVGQSDIRAFLKCLQYLEVLFFRKRHWSHYYDLIKSNLPKVDKIVTSATRADINRSPECKGNFEHHGTVDLALSHRLQMWRTTDRRRFQPLSLSKSTTFEFISWLLVIPQITVEVSIVSFILRRKMNCGHSLFVLGFVWFRGGGYVC